MVGGERALAGLLDERELRLVVALEVRRAALPRSLVAGVGDVQHRGRAQLAQLAQEVENRSRLLLAVLVRRPLEPGVWIERDQAPAALLTCHTQPLAPLLVIEFDAP